MITLKRCYLPDSTPGVIEVPGLGQWFTCEQPWRDNRKSHSCIPERLYDLLPHNTPRHPDTWVAVNHDMGVYERDAPAGLRDECLFCHIGNGAPDVQGCACIGKGHMIYRGTYGVSDSAVAMQEYRAAVKSYQAAGGQMQLHIVRDQSWYTADPSDWVLPA